MYQRGGRLSLDLLWKKKKNTLVTFSNHHPSQLPCPIFFSHGYNASLGARSRQCDGPSNEGSRGDVLQPEVGRLTTPWRKGWLECTSIPVLSPRGPGSYSHPAIRRLCCVRLPWWKWFGSALPHSYAPPPSLFFFFFFFFFKCLLAQLATDIHTYVYIYLITWICAQP